MAMKSVLFCFLAISAIFMASAFPQVKPENFLRRFGYLKEQTGNERSEAATPEELHQAILKFQSFYGLPQTGMMDDETSKKMMLPRCGVKDNFGNGEMAEYNLVSKWPTNFLTWKISKYSRTSRLSPAEQKRAISRGLKRWAEVAPLVFKETGDKPTIDISFERLNHGDGYRFDGSQNNRRSTVLAHAFYPQNGDVHFDDDEQWVNGNEHGTDLETVAAHEFGHALGLNHSNHPKSLMAPHYQIFPDNFKLHSDDIAGIQKLYGKKPVQVTTNTTNTTTATRRTPPTLPSPRGTGFCNCSYRSIDAAMRISDKDFVFVDKYDIIDGEYGQKTPIQIVFPGGPASVQAAVYSTQIGKVYLFKDDYVWTFTINSYGQFQLTKNSPKQLSNNRVHKPESAVRFYYYGSERIFLIKNGTLVEFMPYYEKVAPGMGYPARDFFTNIPSTIDASIASDYAVHFIVKNKAYTMPNLNRRVFKQGKPVMLAFQKCKIENAKVGRSA